MIGLTVPIRTAAAPFWAALQVALDDIHHQVPCTTAPDVWAGDEYDLDRIEYAERRCLRCPVLEQCGAYAAAARETGAVWGGRHRSPKRTLTQEIPA